MATIPVTRATDASGDVIELPDAPNVGQFGNTGERLAAINDAITYANAAKESAAEAGVFAADADGSAEAARVWAEAAEASQIAAAQSEQNTAQSEQNAAQSAATAESAIAEAEDMRHRWETMSAVTSTLGPGEQAEASWDAEAGVMYFAIPRGMDGKIADMGEAVIGKPDAGGYVIYANAEGEISKAKVSDLAGLLPKGIHQRGTVDADSGDVIDWEGLLTHWSYAAPPVQEGESPDGVMFVVTKQGYLQLAEEGEYLEFFPGDQIYWQTDGGGWLVNYQQVTSVNGKTRDVVLTPADVGALPKEGGAVNALSCPDLEIPPAADGTCNFRFIDAEGRTVALFYSDPETGILSCRTDTYNEDGEQEYGLTIQFDHAGNLILPVDGKMRGTTHDDDGNTKYFDILGHESSNVTAIGDINYPLELRAFTPPTVTVGEKSGMIFTELNPPTVDQVEGAYSEANPPTNYGWKEIGDKNLNAVATSGYYFQSDYKNATPEKNYPEPHTGFLWVLNQDVNSTQIWVTQGSANIYARSFAKVTGWLPWQRLMTSDGGEFTGAISVPALKGLHLAAVDDTTPEALISSESGHTFLAQRRKEDGEDWRFIGLNKAGQPTFRDVTPDTEPGYADHRIYHEGYPPPGSNLQAILDAVYPVGICLTFAANVNPNTLYSQYGHTWENLAATMGNRALVVNSDATGAGVGTAKGADSHTLTNTELPAHGHGVGTLAIAAAGNHGHTTTTSTTGNHTHALYGTGSDSGANGANSYPADGKGGHETTMTGGHVMGLAGNHTHTVNIAANGNHTHALSGSTAAAGGGAAFSLWQPSVLVNVWKRTK